MADIKYIERASGLSKTEQVPGKGMLKWLYNSDLGKVALQLLVKRKIISVLGGWYMNTKMSAKRIRKFVNEHQINLEEYEINDVEKFNTFNNFFYRKLKKEARPVGNNLVSPADGKIVVFQRIKDISTFFIKGSEFSLNSFLKNEELAKKYAEGAMAIIRLAPPDYHRFHFPADGKVSESKKIGGHYYSVSPFALKKSLEIFCRNYREYCLLETDKYGDLIISDIGATMVGSIIQTYIPNSNVHKGDEKGYFAFGGSTLVLLFEKDKITFDQDLITNTNNGFETSIRMGEKIAS